MAYKVELNRLTKVSRLVYVATVHRDNIGGRGEPHRRVVRRGGRDYHVTKGWR